MSFDFSTIVTILVAIMVLQPLLMGRWSAVRRAQAIRAVERAHGARIITMIHRQEKRSLLGFSVSRHIDLEDARYHRPLRRDVRRLAAELAPEGEVVLLGSVATTKYVDPLLEILGERLRFPSEFVGRGDMSRGGLLLRCVRNGRELTYVPVAGAMRRGSRPARLEPLR